MRVMLPCECDQLLTLPKLDGGPDLVPAVCPVCKTEFSVLREIVLRGTERMEKATFYVAPLAKLTQAVVNGLRSRLDAALPIAVG